MMLIEDSWVVSLLVAAATLLILLYYYFKAPYNYWKKRGVPYAKPSLFFGNFKDQFLLRKNFFLVVDDIYKALRGEKFGGYFEFRTPVLMIRDQHLIEKILVKDFSYFTDRDFGAGVDLKKEPLTGNLFNLKGQLWKNLRNKLTPTFTTGKLKSMLDQMCNCGDELLGEIEKKSQSNTALDAKDLGSRYTVDVTASVSFGLQFKPDSPEGIKYRQTVDSVFAPSSLTMLRNMIIFQIKGLAKLLKLRQFPKEVSDYMIDLVKATIDFRKKNNIQRNDFMQLMINLKDQEGSGKNMNWKAELSEEDAYLNHIDFADNDGNQENKMQVITDECIAAQAFVFLTGGAEAVANSVSYTLFELALNPHVQTRLQQEVDETIQRYGGKITYEGLKEMTYLDLVIQERNRKYSEGGFLQRVCNAPYLIPGTNIVLEKGTRVVIPLYSIHNDPAFYPEPSKFVPERFEGNNYRSSGTYLPFGDGPRVCIAMRFVILELKACIAKLMSQYTVTLDPRTKVPIQYDPKSFIFQPIGGIWVRFQKRTNTLS